MAKKTKSKRRDLRIIMSSNAPWAPSGYGVFVREWGKLMVEDGWPLAVSCFYGLEGGKLNYNGIECYPKMNQSYGTDALFHHGRDFGAHVYFSMQDTPLLDPNFLKQIPTWIPYAPIHYSPPSPFVQDRLKYAYKILVFSEFGKQGLMDKGFSSTKIPEGLNTEVFKPMDQSEIRKGWGIPDDIFMFGMVGANKEVPTRKGFQEAIDAFAMFTREHPKSGLFIHTLHPPLGAFDIVDYAKNLGIENRIYTVDNYNALFKSPHEVIAREMNMFDVLLQPSRTEGFGLPIIEAQACGKPVIVTDFSAMPELILPKKTGTACKVQKLDWSNQRGYWATPDIQSLYEQMEFWYKKLKTDKDKVAKKARKHILTNYDLSVIFKERWVPLLEDLQEQILGKKENE